MNKKKEKKIIIPFGNAVKSTPSIKKCYAPGLRALGEYSNKVEIGTPSMCNGSIDIDSCTKSKHPNANRWDYAFSYKNEIFFIEVHTANTGEVSTVIRKFKWLKEWLRTEAPHINALKARSRSPFYWVQSNGFHILPQSRQYREVTSIGLRPIRKLTLT